MAVTSHFLASGPGWRVDDVVCTAGPRDRPFEERHDGMCIAAVSEGTFQYRSTRGTAALVPGALLLGNDQQCFSCGHDHGTGDRCLSFRFAPEFLEVVAAGVPGMRSIVFAVPCLPPLPTLIPVLAAAEIAREEVDGGAFEELALDLAAITTAALAGTAQSRRAPSRRDELRIAAAVRRIEALACQRLSLADLARDAAMSPYHFLRTFRAVVGMTPYRYLLRTRLHRAAVRLRRSNDSISDIAFDCGFGDLSTFNRRFRRLMGLNPGTYRA